MCKLSESQALNAAKVGEESLVKLLTDAGIIDTPMGKTITGYAGTLITDIEAWVPGTFPQEALEVVQDIENELPSLPIPTPFNVFVPLALGLFATVFTLLSANSPAPGIPPVDAGSPDGDLNAAAQTFHAHAVGAAGEAKVYQLTGYKPSVFDKGRAALGDTHVVANAYKSRWEELRKENNLPETLKLA
jgi:hypothetical protein